MNGINGPSTSKFVSGYLAGLEFEIGDRYAFRVQAGQSGFAQVRYVTDNTAKIVSLIPGLTAFQLASYCTNGKLGNGWNVVFYSDYGVDSVHSQCGWYGAVFGSGFSLALASLGIFGAAVDFPVFSNLTLRPQLTYDLVSSSTTPRIHASPGNVILENSIKLGNHPCLPTLLDFKLILMFPFLMRKLIYISLIVFAGCETSLTPQTPNRQW